MKDVSFVINKCFKLIILIVFILLIFNSECSVILPSYVHKKNISKPALSEITDSEVLNNLKPTDRIKVTMKNNKIYSGQFIGLYKHDQSTYNKFYRKFIDDNPKSNLPDIGDTLLISLQSGEKFECRFLGFDYYQMVAETLSSNIIKNIDISHISFAELQNKSIKESINLTSLFNIAKLQIPLYTNIAVKSENGDLVLHIHEIERLEKINKKHSIIKYLILGLVLDSFAVVTTIAFIGLHVSSSLQ